MGENNISGKIYAVRLSPDFHDAGIGEKNNIGPANFVLSVRPIPWYLFSAGCYQFSQALFVTEREKIDERRRENIPLVFPSLCCDFNRKRFHLSGEREGKKGGKKNVSLSLRLTKLRRGGGGADSIVIAPRQKSRFFPFSLLDRYP